MPWFVPVETLVMWLDFPLWLDGKRQNILYHRPKLCCVDETLIMFCYTFIKLYTFIIWHIMDRVSVLQFHYYILHKTCFS